MSVSSLNGVWVGTENLDEARKFLTDFGLSKIEDDGEKLTFSPQNGAEFMVRHLEDPKLPQSTFNGSRAGMREVIWACDSQEELADSLAKAQATGDVEVFDDGSFLIIDPDNLRHRVTLKYTQEVTGDPHMPNSVNVHNRVNKRAPVYQSAKPLHLSHVVMWVSSFKNSVKFFTERLGLIITDSYPGQAAFLRAKICGEHHNAFIIEGASAGTNHIAFTVNDLHEVIGGGLNMGRHNWSSELGPGRHPISSAMFWYVKSPFGCSIEYFTDDDYCTEDWVPGEFPRTPENFAEWAITGGVDGNTRRQKKVEKNIIYREGVKND